MKFSEQITMILKSGIDTIANPIIYVQFSYPDKINKGNYQESEHPRTSNGKYTYKGIMELSEAERKELIEKLEQENYVEYDGFFVSEFKIDSVLQGKYAEEVKACKELKILGFTPYLLRESYSGGAKADTFIKEDNSEFKDFLEIKDTNRKHLFRQYHKSLEQAPAVFITATEELSNETIKKLKDEANENINEILVILNNNGKIIELKNKTT